MTRLQLTLKRLFASYPNTQITDASVAAYLDMLQVIPAGEVEAAVQQAMIESPQFLPPAPAIVAQWRKLTTPEAPTAGEAWGSVEKALRHVGSWGKPKFNDPTTARVVEMMGWLNLCQSENLDTIRAQFRDMYNQLSAREQAHQRLLPAARQLAEGRGALRQIGGAVGRVLQIAQVDG